MSLRPTCCLPTSLLPAHLPVAAKVASQPRLTALRRRHARIAASSGGEAPREESDVAGAAGKLAGFFGDLQVDVDALAAAGDRQVRDALSQAVDSAQDAGESAAYAAASAVDAAAAGAEAAAAAGAELTRDFAEAMADAAAPAAGAALPAGEEIAGELPAAGESTASGQPGPTDAGTHEAMHAVVARLKDELIRLVAGLDRGLAASDDVVKKVDSLAARLEAIAGAVVLTWSRPDDSPASTMAMLDGRWRLIYSSAFSTGSLGGRRAGPPVQGPVILGPVYQDIFTDRAELDNTVELLPKFSLASLPGISAEVPTATARLKHSFEVDGARTVRITFEDTEVKLSGGLGGWLDSVPTLALPSLPEALRPPRGMRAATFDVTFLDAEMRITRGDRGEIRVFLKGMA